MSVPTLRVLTLNLQHGNPAGQRTGHRPLGSAALLETAAELRRLDPDVVLLQEVDRGQLRSAHVDQSALLARELHLPVVRFAAAFAGSATGLRWRPCRSDARRGYGVAVLSRHRAVSHHVRRMPGALAVGRSRRGRWRVVTEPRVCLAVTLLTPLGPLTAASTHLTVDAARARDQLTGCERALRALPGPHLLGGDLNLGPEEVAAVTTLRPLAHAPTFPNHRPRRQIDHLLGSPALVPVGPAAAHHLPVSDHAGLSVEVGRA